MKLEIFVFSCILVFGVVLCDDGKKMVRIFETPNNFNIFSGQK